MKKRTVFATVRFALFERGICKKIRLCRTSAKGEPAL